MEDNVRALASTSGLQVDSLQRLCLQGDNVADTGDIMENQALTSFEALGEKDPLWVNADGTFTPVFKRKYLWQSLEASKEELIDTILGGLAAIEGLGVAGEAMRAQFKATLKVVPVVAKLGVVLR